MSNIWRWNGYNVSMLIFNFWLILWLCGSGYLLTRDIHEIILASFQPVLSYGHPWRQVARVPQDGGKRKTHHKKKIYELGCLAANIKIGPSHMPTVRVQGGNKKFHALRLDVGNPSCGSECCMCKTQIVDVVHHASNNELVLTKILIKKNCIVLIDSTPHHSGACPTRHCPRATWRGPRRLLRK